MAKLDFVAGSRKLSFAVIWALQSSGPVSFRVRYHIPMTSSSLDILQNLRLGRGRLSVMTPLVALHSTCNLAEMIDVRKMPTTSRKGSPWHGKAVLPLGLIWAAHAAVHCVPHHPRSSAFPAVRDPLAPHVMLITELIHTYLAGPQEEMPTSPLGKSISVF